MASDFLGTIMGFVGPEGAGKTLAMAYCSLRHLAEGGQLLAFPGFEIKNPKTNEVLSKPLPMEEWLTLPPDLRNCLIAIDEVQNFANSMKHMSWINYLFANIAAQRRHRNIGLMYTVQDWAWLDNRIRWLTHILVVCYDLFWSPWGKEQGLKRGELLNLTFYDVKGFRTGRPWTQSPPFRLRAKAIWNWYDSFCDVDIFSGMADVRIRKPKYTLDITGVAEEEPSPQPTARTPQSASTDDEILTDLLNTPGVKPTTLAKLGRRLAGGNP